MIRQWLNLCEHLHGEECHFPIWPGYPLQPKHSLVVDVELRCVVPAPTECRFVALSYVWGSAKQKKLTRTNWDVLRKPGALDRSELPATIWDAMLVTKAIGQKYCWIDALCIYQDDPASQQDQISQMGAIYSRSLVTIVNTAGDASTGLPGLHAGTRTIRQAMINLHGFNLIRVVDDGDSHTDSLDNVSTWEKRAWTFQEGLFSQRMLIFRKNQVYWHCRTATWVEEKILEIIETSVALCSVERLLYRNPEIPRSLAEQESRFSRRIEDKKYRLYRGFVDRYTFRQLSIGSDALNAFAGISRALCLLSKDEFVWGIPKSNFPDALAWVTLNQQRNSSLQNLLMLDGSVRQMPFPSWSWASHFGGDSSEVSRGISVSRKGTTLEPGLIVFFSCLLPGGIIRITPSTEFHNEPSQCKRSSNCITAKWLGHPRVIDNAPHVIPGNEMIHSGTLKFWTSVATVYYFQERQRLPEPARHTVLSSDRRAIFATPHLNSWSYVRSDDSRLPEKVRLAELKNVRGDDLEGDCDITILDLVVISGEALEITGGISGLSGTGRMLDLLSVGWEDGVAFREGLVNIAEEHWVSLKNREWKLITLR